MATWRKGESISRAMAREGGQILKGVGRELLSIATLGVYRPSRRSRPTKKMRR